jgi:hypothetical protein
MENMDHVRPPPSTAPPPPPPLPAATPLTYATPQPQSPVRAVGLAQRRIMWVILGAILLMFSFVGGFILVPQNSTTTLGMLALIGLLRLALIVLMMVGVYQLAAALGSSMTARVLFVLAMLIPFVGLLVLLVLNQQATTLLRRHNVRVGLMGARVSELPSA